MTRHLAGTLVLVGALAACASTEPDDRPAAQAAGVSAGEYQQWLISGDVSNDFEARLLRSEQANVQACMAERGFDYTPITDPRVWSTSPVLYTDEAYVREWGFGVVRAHDELSSRQDVEDPNFVHLRDLSESQRDAYTEAFDGGDGLGGCLATARAAVREELGVEDLVAAVEANIAAALASPEVVDATKTWSECAAGFGYEYPSISALVEDLGNEFDAIAGGPAAPINAFRQQEIRIATAVLPCSQAWKETRDRVVLDFANSALEAAGS